VFRVILSTSLTVVAAALVILCLAADTLNIWLLSFLYSFRMHLGAAALASGLMALLFWRRNLVALLLVLVTLLTTGLAYLHLHSFAPTPPFAARPTEEPNFRVVSFNVLGVNRQGENAAKLIRDLDPDIAIVLEAGGVIQELRWLSEIYPYRIGCGVIVRQCDSMILSKYKIRNARAHDLSRFSPNRMLEGDIEVGGVPMRIVSAHLIKPYYDIHQRSEIWEIIRRLHYYEGNLILTGDFNSSFMQPTTRRIPDLLDLQTGPYEPATWPVRAGRWGIAIDHILARPPFVITATHRIEDNAGSNHYGIYADIHVPGLGKGSEAHDVVAATP
jgi:endonuclease/exonuclease/phosphatase (EEP) superfamily protein YafD